MANQITIDIVAQTQKLTSGINDANGQIDGMSSKLKGAAAAAGAAASAFVLKQGITFLKQGIDEAKEAAETMRAATTTFGEGSAALEKITKDADAFGKAIAVDNDVIIQLSTQLGSRLPADAKALSAELVNVAFDVEAYTGGAVAAEAVTGKLAKAFADGEITAKELSKIVPDLEDATYAQAEAASKAGDNQKALDIIIAAAQKKYGDAAEKNVTSTQKFETALANFKETLGTKVLPILEKGIDFLTKLIGVFDGLPGPIQNGILALAALIAIGGPILTFLASMRTALITLGIVTQAQTGSQIALNTAMLANPIGIVIAAIVAIIAVGVLLYKNWDTVTEYAGKLWDKIKEVFGWIKENWQLLLAILTGPIGLAVKYIIDNFDDIKDKASSIVNYIRNIFDDLPDKMANIGRNIVSGLWNGMQSMVSWLRDKVTGFFKNLIPDWAEKALGIASPSKVFAGIGQNIINGLSSTFNAPAVKSVSNRAQAGIAVPKISLPSLQSRSGINVTINAGLGTDPYKLGKEVSSAISKYGRVSGTTVRR
jgi:phage-related protein